MDPKEFQQLVEKSVLQYPLNEVQQEERIIELADLVHFVDCFRPSLKIREDQPVGFNIVEERGSRIGVIVCEEERAAEGRNHLTSNDDLSVLKRNEDLESIWLVVVNSSLRSEKTSYSDLSLDLPAVGFDHVFGFNFFARQVYQFR
jgi:hypothetical protein